MTNLDASASNELDQAVCHCDLAPLQAFVLALEAEYDIRVIREPSVCLTMIRAADSLENQEFLLGEALSTECEVTVDGLPGVGICLGEEASRTYCLAVLDALRDTPAVREFAAKHLAILAERDRREFAQVMRTKVDFKLLEQE